MVPFSTPVRASTKIKLYDTNAPFSFPDIPSLVFESDPQLPVTPNLGGQITKYLKDHQGREVPHAFVWNDLLVGFSPRAFLKLYCLQWPLDNDLLFSNVSHKSRCAIRSDVLETLYDKGEIPSKTDTTKAFSYIAKNSWSNIIELDNVFRYPRSVHHSVFSPLSSILPSEKASSISIIVNYREKPDLMYRCIRSLASQKVTANLEVILINNQSSSKTKDYVKKLGMTYLRNMANVIHLDFNAPFNHSSQNILGAEVAKGEILVFLNNDAKLLGSKVIQTLADWAMTPNVATVGPKILGNGGRLVSSGIEINLTGKQLSPNIQESTVIPLSNLIRKTAGNSFACAATAKNTWCKLNGLNPKQFPNQYNDADYCIRALQKGYLHIYAGNVSIYHEPGGSQERTVQDVRALHGKLLNIYPHMGKYSRIAPVLRKLKPIPKFNSFTPEVTMRLIRVWRKWQHYVQKMN